LKNISIILINYNTAKFTLDCITSIYKNTTKTIDFEIIVVDNNSEDEDYKILCEGLKKNPDVVLHSSPINTGFGGGNMLGFQYAKGQYVLFINNDVVLKNDVLSTAYNFMETNLSVGVCTAQNFDEHNNFVPSFDHDKGLRKLIFGRSFLEAINPQKYPKRKLQHKVPLDVNFVNGAFMFFRKKQFEKVGGFDTNIFLYFEEMDICYRLRKRDYKCVLLPKAKIVHFQGASTGISTALKKEGFISYLYVLKKNYSCLKFKIIQLYLVITFLVKPKKWNLLSIAIMGGNMESSLKQKQVVKSQELN